MWKHFKSKETINKKGSEGGIIIEDEEHSDGARITLEQDTDVAPYAITVGVYGCFFHTVYNSSFKDSFNQYERMKRELSDCFLRPEELEEKWIESFVNKYQ